MALSNLASVRAGAWITASGQATSQATIERSEIVACVLYKPVLCAFLLANTTPSSKSQKDLGSYCTKFTSFLTDVDGSSTVLMQ